MGISISLDRVWSLLQDRGQRKRENVFAYMDTVADEAQLLAETWEAILKEVAKGDRAKAQNHGSSELDQMLMFNLGYQTNSPPYFRLCEFYSQISVAAGGKLNEEWLDQFIRGTAKVIRQRGEVVRSYPKLIDRMGSVMFVNEVNNIDALRELSESVTVLQREAAALRVLSQTIRATYGQ